MKRAILIFLLCAFLPALVSCTHREKKSEPEPEIKEPVIHEETFKPGESFWGTAVYIGQQVEDYYEQAICLDMIAGNFAAAELFDQATATTGLIGDPYMKSQTLGEIAQFLISKNNIEGGVKLLDEALEISRNLVDPMEKATSMTLVAHALENGGQTQKAADIRKEIDTIVTKMKTEFPSDSPPNPSDQIIERLEMELEEIKNLADSGDFTAALTAAKGLDNLSARAVALSYIAYVKKDVESSITDDEVKILTELMTIEPRPPIEKEEPPNSSS